MRKEGRRYNNSQTSNGNRLYVGNFDRNGWNVNDYHPDWNDNGNIRVVVSREFRLFLFSQ